MGSPTSLLWGILGVQCLVLFAVLHRARPRVPAVALASVATRLSGVESAQEDLRVQGQRLAHQLQLFTHAYTHVQRTGLTVVDEHVQHIAALMVTLNAQIAEHLVRLCVVETRLFGRPDTIPTEESEH